ncbi:hypothetical protein AAY473_032362 [Plecturocebus cupreus]
MYSNERTCSSLCVDQAGLKLLTSSDLPALASQSAGIIGLSHRLALKESRSVAQAECSGMISAHHNLCLLDSSNSPVSVSWVAGITGVRHHAWLIFVFLVETRFHHVGQACLKLVTTQIGWITGAPEFKTSLGNMARSHLYKKSEISQAWWCALVVPAAHKVEAEGSLGPRRSRLHRSKEVKDEHTSLTQCWPRTPELKNSSHLSFPKCWDYRHEPPCLA